MTRLTSCCLVLLLHVLILTLPQLPVIAAVPCLCASIICPFMWRISVYINYNTHAGFAVASFICLLTSLGLSLLSLACTKRAAAREGALESYVRGMKRAVHAPCLTPPDAVACSCVCVVCVVAVPPGREFDFCKATAFGHSLNNNTSHSSDPYLRCYECPCCLFSSIALHLSPAAIRT